MLNISGFRRKPDSRGALPFSIKNPSKYMTSTYVGSLLVIACLSLVIHSVLDNVIQQGSQTGLIVNVSGQQRMLSQRASMFALEYLNSGSPEAKELAQAASHKMLKNHEFLLDFHRQNGKTMSGTMSAMYFEAPLNVDTQVRTFTGEIDRLLAFKPGVISGRVGVFDFMFSRMAKNELLNGLNTVVKQYENESTARVEDLQQVQRIVLCCGSSSSLFLLRHCLFFAPWWQRSAPSPGACSTKLTLTSCLAYLIVGPLIS
jgi:hypothetical protein